ncbi:MAG: hypothetical protein K0U98_25735 [Deltaproteobacteria bacterium]|nr:hypothetical protein [Deltaproteobacteria bacterium]
MYSASRHNRRRFSGGTLRIIFTVAMLAMLPVTITAETITVGALAEGCDFDQLSLAWVRAAVTPEADTILLAADQSHTLSTPLTLTGASRVTIRGIRDCSNDTTWIRTIEATRGDLFRLIDTDLTIDRVTLETATGGGRPLTASGTSLITLVGARVVGGVADEGGNVHLSEGASLALGGSSTISAGSAIFNGGGVFCSGPGLISVSDTSAIFLNHADFNGGGFYLTSGCALHVTANDTGGVNANNAGIKDNDANNDGGGVYATSGAEVVMLGNRHAPARVHDNLARRRGGGIYLNGIGTTGTLIAAEVSKNHGRLDGGGFYVANGAELTMDHDLEVCDRGIRCSLLDTNFTTSTSEDSTEGGGIAVTTGGRAEIRQTLVTGNSAEDGNVAWVDGSDSFLLIEGSALFNNNSVGVHVLAENGGHARMGFVSAWGSSEEAGVMALAQALDSSRIDLYSSIVIEGNGLGGLDRVFGPPGVGGLHRADCTIVHEFDSLPAAGVPTATMVTNPAFIWKNPSVGDPTLVPTAIAIDYCDALTYFPVDTDIFGDERGIDDPTVADFIGPYDLGAAEHPAASPEIFADGFESGDLSRWTLAIP